MSCRLVNLDVQSPSLPTFGEDDAPETTLPSPLETAIPRRESRDKRPASQQKGKMTGAEPSKIAKSGKASWHAEIQQWWRCTLALARYGEPSSGQANVRNRRHGAGAQALTGHPANLALGDAQILAAASAASWLTLGGARSPLQCVIIGTLRPVQWVCRSRPGPVWGPDEGGSPGPALGGGGVNPGNMPAQRQCDCARSTTVRPRDRGSMDFRITTAGCRKSYLFLLLWASLAEAGLPKPGCRSRWQGR